MKGAVLLGPPVDASTLHGAIAGQLEPMPFGLAREAALGRQLLRRVRQSAHSQRDLCTVRREDGPWLALGPGARRCVLREDAGTRIELLRLQADAVASWPDDALAQEVFVVHGELALEGSALAPSLLPRHRLCVHRRAEERQWRAVGGEAWVYVRYQLGGIEPLDALEARWWAAALTAGAMPAPSWRSVSAGVDMACLFGHGPVVSMLVRVAPGACLPGHGHRLDEDCLMLEGELFIGDILMRVGDFQHAPRHGRHLAGSSEDGALFYFHGALPGAD
jgi:ChrR Cupin-like domain